MTTNTPSLGYPATGITLSTKEKFHPGDFLGCVPVLTVRNSEHWLYRLSALGINPIAIRKETNTVSYLCTNKTGACKMMISSPIGDTGHRARAIQSHGAHFSELIIFCSDEESADIAASLCEKIVTNSRPVNDFLFPITASYGVEIYPGTRYTFVAMDDEETVWRSWKAYALPNPYMDPDLDIKLDHIVQNLPADVYDQCRQLFETFGMETTFYGTDKVEFATRAFSPDKGIFDLMPFFAINKSDTLTSQINVGIQEHGAPFIQHLAFHVNDWCTGAACLTSVDVPVMGLSGRTDMENYYQTCRASFEEVFPETDFERFKTLGGLYDIDCEGAEQPLGLQQSFFNTIDSIDRGSPGRLTCFFELIQRSAHALTEDQLRSMDKLKGSCAGFGGGNFGNLAGDVKHHSVELHRTVQL